MKSANYLLIFTRKIFLFQQEINILISAFCPKSSPTMQLVMASYALCFITLMHNDISSLPI